MYLKKSVSILRPSIHKLAATLCSTRTCQCREISSTATAGSLPKQLYDYFLVLDFEATCDKPTTPEPQEIIEFPVLKINAANFEKESVFHEYVQPQVNRELSPFCTQLTGIIQEMVDGKPHLDAVLAKFDLWMKHEGLLSEGCKSIFVTSDEWDLKSMLTKQCNHFRIQKPAYFDSWINIKKSYAQLTGTWPKSLPTMCQELGLPIVGRLHSGIDDCHTIASVLRALGKQGYVFHPFPKVEPTVVSNAKKKTSKTGEVPSV